MVGLAIVRNITFIKYQSEMIITFSGKKWETQLMVLFYLHDFLGDSGSRDPNRYGIDM